ncbi:MAG TPA: non-homologous end-joining DNA ligase [Acidimicrobiales bacterium]|nr:non-homologous end-joining DNA ligase [Acidimicrobiales bacterium]
MAAKSTGKGAASKARKLDTYRAKRDSKKTPEPMGIRSTKGSGEQRFVIQEHHATSLHWDLRLERDGVLASWALPKGLPETPEKNHLAVHTEDHPLEYATFEGKIPQGEYGGGQMTIWDTGHYDVEKWSDAEVKFVLHGTRAVGSFVLFQTKDRNWMIHRHGASTRADALPDAIKPMLAVAGKVPADSEGWAFEIKWDGVRAILFIEGGRVRAQSRNDIDVTVSFPELADIGKFLGMTTCVLDGEIVALGDDGRPSFSRLQRRIHVSNQREAKRRSTADPVSFVAFDLLYIDGHSLMDAPYDERRERLEALHLTGETFTTTEAFRDVSGPDILQATVENGLEGVVAKRRNSPYRPGRRSPDWTKVKSFRTQEIVIGAWTDGQGERLDSLGALLLGIPDDGGLRYVGKVGTGFSAQARAEILRELRPLASQESPFLGTLPSGDAGKAHFVRPELVGEVEFGEWTGAGRLRHPTWRGLRPDKLPGEVVVE